MTAEQPLVLDDLRSRRQSTLMASRSTGLAFVMPKRRVVFGRYDDPAAIYTTGDIRLRLYVGRLVGF